MSADVYSGVLLAESLKVDASLDEVPITVIAISRKEAGNIEVGQPRLWTFIEFQVAADQADRLGQSLMEALSPHGGWYCDFRTNADTFVVFSGKMFHYQRSDRAAREEAQAYGRSVGVPEEQLDWPDNSAHKNSDPDKRRGRYR